MKPDRTSALLYSRQLTDKCIMDVEVFLSGDQISEMETGDIS